MMKLAFFLLVIFALSPVGGDRARAAQLTAACDGSLERLLRAHDAVRTYHRHFKHAQQHTRLASSHLVACLPGAIFSVSRARRCAQAQFDVPLFVQRQVAAADQLSEAIVAFREARQHAAHECPVNGALAAQQDVLRRIASLEKEIQSLTLLLEQFLPRKKQTSPSPSFEE